MTLEEASKVWEGFGFCGCANPKIVLERMGQILKANKELWLVLRLESNASDNSKNAWEVYEKVFSSDAEKYLYLYVMDKGNLMEHGGSVNGAWLTPEGEQFLCAIEEFGADTIADYEYNKVMSQEKSHNNG